MVWVSMMARNSPRMGSSDSSAISFRLSSSGKPALMPRTIRSTASGKAVEETRQPPFLEERQQPQGRPQPAAKATPSAGNRPAPVASTRKNAPKPSEPAVSKNRRFDQVSPACEMRAASGRRLAFFCRSSISLSVPCTCSRRDCCAEARRYRLRPRDACHAPFRVPFAGKERINEYPGDPADRERHQSEDEVHVHLIDSRAVSSAASSAAASRCSSP